MSTPIVICGACGVPFRPDTDDDLCGDCIEANEAEVRAKVEAEIAAELRRRAQQAAQATTFDSIVEDERRAARVNAFEQAADIVAGSNYPRGGT